MSELICKCGCKASIHYVLGCRECFSCPNTPADIQRAAAIAHLRSIVKRRDIFKRPSVGWNRLDNELWAAVAAFKAVSVL